MKHHTKDKGDKGVGFIIADLLKNGIQVAIPISEHLPFDLIAISKSGQLNKLSVKYKAMKNGRIEIPLKSSWSNKKGVHIKKSNKKIFDSTAIYCPDNEKCYYINNNEIGYNISLRILKPKKKCKTIKYAKNYINPERIFNR